MKKLIAVILALASFAAYAEPTDVTVRQRRADDMGYLDRFIAFPAGGISCLFALDGPTVLPGCYTLGTGLTLTGTVLTASGTAGPQGPQGIPGTSAAVFNFGAPVAKTVALNTAYQAADITKASMVTISPACTNATTLLAASACTLTVRQSAAAGLTCSTGTVVATWSSTIALGLVITQGNSFPIDIKLPAGGYFAVCPTAGTFTISAVEQTAG